MCPQKSIAQNTFSLILLLINLPSMKITSWRENFYGASDICTYNVCVIFTPLVEINLCSMWKINAQ